MDAACVERIAGLLVAARRTVVLTGAGISTPSGIPDFRSPRHGLWQQVDPEVVASLAGFQRNPRAFAAWLRPLLRKILLAAPNPAHHALARLESAGLVRAIITQNIDGLHQKAGSRHVVELHGHLREAGCLRCDYQTPTAGLLEAFLASGEVPACPRCGGVLKPSVVLFGEMLPLDVLREAQEEAAACDLMLVAGSSLSVVPASLLPHPVIDQGGRLIIINRTPTDLDRQAEVVVRDDVAAVLPAVAEACARRPARDSSTSHLASGEGHSSAGAVDGAGDAGTAERADETP